MARTITVVADEKYIANLCTYLDAVAGVELQDVYRFEGDGGDRQRAAVTVLFDDAAAGRVVDFLHLLIQGFDMIGAEPEVTLLDPTTDVEIGRLDRSATATRIARLLTQAPQAPTRRRRTRGLRRDSEDTDDYGSEETPDYGAESLGPALGVDATDEEDEPSGPAWTAPEPAPPITCHVRAEMESTLLLRRVTTIEVTVSREAIGGATGASARESAIIIDSGRKLIVQVLPKANVEVVGDDRVEIDPPGAGEPQALYFDIRPTDLGQAEVWVVVRQGQLPLTTLELAAPVTRSTERPRQMLSAEASGSSGTPLAAPLHQLRIAQAERGGSMIYTYELEAPALNLLGYWESKPIVGNRVTYVAALYKSIEDRWLSSDQDVAEFTEELREFGVDLLDELVPEPLQQILWDNRDRLTSIQVLGNEPFIPWELVHLREPGKPFPEETRFLGQMGLVRWLYQGGWPPSELRVRPGQARYVIPEYPDPRYQLPETIAERQFLEATFGATAVESQPNPVRELLSSPGAFDLLHFACHGVAEADNVTDAKLVLQGRYDDGTYVPSYLSATTADTRSNLRGPDGTRPIIVLNACQAGRAGYRLTGIGGFAQAFLKGQAGAFVGTLWSVGDVPARVFTETFYTQLLAGKTVAEAAVEAREQARADGDATWLAYAVYAHPHATLSCQ